MTSLSTWKYAAILLLAFAGNLGCARHRTGSTQTKPAGPKRGDHIVIEQTAAEFFEARVLAAHGETLEVQTTEGGDFRRVQTSDAYRLPPPPHAFRTGDLAICSARAGHWEPCRIEAVKGSRIDAVDGKGGHLQLAPSAVLAPTALTRLDLQRYFELARRHQAFAHAAAAAGRPRAPKGWRPEPHEQVLARHDSRWYSATIHEVDDDVLRVRWRADSRISELPYDAVVPAPPYNHEIHRGEFVLARPTSLAVPWQPVEVIAVGPDSVQVSNIDGDHRSLRPTDVVPLGH